MISLALALMAGTLVILVVAVADGDPQYVQAWAVPLGTVSALVVWLIAEREKDGP